MNYLLYSNIPTTDDELYHLVMNPTTLQAAPKGYKNPLEFHIGTFCKSHFINCSCENLKKKGRTYQRFILRQLGHLNYKTRRFPSPSHGGFSFIGTKIFGNLFLLEAFKPFGSCIELEITFGGKFWLKNLICWLW
mgnify:CR=1 FL=1